MFFILQNFYKDNDGKSLPNNKIHVKIFFDEVTLCINNFEICVNLNVNYTQTELEDLFNDIIKVEGDETYKDYIKDSGTYKWHLPSDITEDVDKTDKKESQGLEVLMEKTGKEIKTTGSIINKEYLKKHLPVSLYENFIIQSIGIAIGKQYELCLISTLFQPNLAEPESKKSKIYLGRSVDNKLTYYVVSPEKKIKEEIKVPFDIKEDLNEQFLRDQKKEILEALLKKRLIVIDQGNIMFCYGEEKKYGGKLWGNDGKKFYNSIAFDIHINICTEKNKFSQLGFFDQVSKQIKSYNIIKDLSTIIDNLKLIKLFEDDKGTGVPPEEYNWFYEQLVDLIVDREFTHKRAPTEAEDAYDRFFGLKRKDDRFFEREDYRSNEINEINEQEKIEIKEKTKTMYTPNYESYSSSSVSYSYPKMSPSTKPGYPNDVFIKGLPMEITESQIRQRFEKYGTILKIKLPDPTNYPYRIAYITFKDREIALKNFNNDNNNTATSNIRNTF